MKAFITPAYTFTPGASGVGTLNLSAIPSFDVKRLVAVLNQTRGTMVYSTGSTVLKYSSVAAGLITLFADTSAMNSADVLQIVYEDPTGAGSATSANQTTEISHLNFIRDVLGARADAPQFDTSITASMTAYLKGLIDITANIQSQEQTTIFGDHDVAAVANPVSQATMIAAIKGVNENLRAQATLIQTQPVAPNISRGSGVMDANTTRVTLATDGPLIAAVGQIADTAATTDIGSFSILAFIKRGLQNWTTLIARIPATLGQKVMASSLAVTFASDQTALAVSGSVAISNFPASQAVTSSSPSFSAASKVLVDFAATNVTNAAYVQILASLAVTTKTIQVFMSSGQPLLLAIGAAASEVDTAYLLPGGNGLLNVQIPAGSRLSVKALPAAATVIEGTLIINVMG